jgi:hypothetical protein
MLRSDPIEEAVLNQWGITVLTEQTDDQERALEQFLQKLLEAVEGLE